jgi:hypothetical protein
MDRLLAVHVLVLLLSWACSAGLPRQRPADLTIRMTRGGGQPAIGAPLMEELVISAEGDSYYMMQYQGGGKISVHLDPSGCDLDELYDVLLENRFSSITTREMKVGDRGGTAVTVEWEGHAHTVQDSGVSFVNEAWEDEWDRIVKALRGYKMDQIEKKQIDLPKQFEFPKLEEEKAQ